MIGVRVTGDRALAARCMRAARRYADTTAPTRQAAKAVERAGRRRAPKRTGRLASSVRARPAGARATIAATARYARYVEYGTGVMRAQPYLRPALYGADITAPYERHAARVAARF